MVLTKHQQLLLARMLEEGSRMGRLGKVYLKNREDKYLDDREAQKLSKRLDEFIFVNAFPIADLVNYGLYRREKIYSALKNLARHNLIIIQNLNLDKRELKRENRNVEKKVGIRHFRKKNQVVQLTLEGISFAQMLSNAQNKRLPS